MSDDVPVAESPRAVITTDASSGVTGNVGTPLLWDVYFAVCAAGVLAMDLVAVDAGRATGRWLVAGLILGMALWYAGFGRRLVDHDRPLWQALLFHAVLLAMFVTAMYLIGLASFLLFALCPLVYLTLDSKAGHGVVALYAFSPALLTLAIGDAQQLSVSLAVGAVVFAISVVIAVATERLERVSAERGRLIEELNASRAEVARLSREAGVAEERQRLAGEIHDTVAQGLSSVVMLVEAADACLDSDPERARGQLRLAARTARENMDEARAIVGALTPSPLAQASLVDALDRLARRAGASFHCDGQVGGLPTSFEVVLLRVAQEALTNVDKHAQAREVQVRLAYHAGGVRLSVTDDGKGFDVADLRSGYGLDAMRARVEQVGGRWEITSRPGAGTTIRTEIPR